MTEKKKYNNKIQAGFLGGLLIGIGLLFLVDNFFYSLSMGDLWPFFMLVPVAVMIAAWLQNKDKYVMIWLPVTILVFYIAYFLWLNATTWSNAETTWPNFLIGPGLGFFVLFLLKKEWGYIIPALTLLILAGIFYSELLDNTFVFSLGFIATGIILILKPVLFPPKLENNT